MRHRYTEAMGREVERDTSLTPSGSTRVATVGDEAAKYWSWREELNLQPVVYKTTALPLSYASPPPSFSESVLTVNVTWQETWEARLAVLPHTEYERAPPAMPQEPAGANHR